ncbi:MAG TPA: aspartate kinase, partial [Bacillota bacterium]|nr:aspartate kinase [Bacillota bacterium]
MKFLVQKFGGTSVATREKRDQVVGHIAQAFQAGYAPVVVVSAMGRQGEPYATDSLLALASQGGGAISPREMDQLLACGEIISGTLLTNTLNGSGYKAVFLTGGQAGIITDEEFGSARIIKVQPAEILRLAREGHIVVVAGFQGLSEKGNVTTLGRGGSDTTAAALGVALNAECIDIFTDVEGIMTADPRIVEDARVLEKVTYNEICQLA